jgi:hypothetical protein
MPELTTDTIEKRGDLYVLLSAAGEVLGEHETRELAEEQERSIEAAKSEASSDSEDWSFTEDFAPFERVSSRDSNGFLRVRATATAPGVYAYVRNGKLRHELKPPEEVFSKLHMDSVHGAVVTDEHPNGVAVTPENSKELQRGHSMAAPTRTPKGLDVDLVVTDESLIEDALSGRKTGVSLGKRNTFEHKPGVWTAPDGSKHPYEVVQRNMVTNHIAIVKRPRVTSAQLHLDSLAQEETDRTDMEKKATLTIDGADFEVDATIASIVKAHLGRQDEKLKALQSKLDEATGTNDSLTQERDTAIAERDTAKAEQDTLKEKLATADSLDINELVTKRQEFLDRAKSVMTSDAFEEVKLKGDLEIMQAACEKSGAKMTQDSEAYIRARFDGLVDAAEQTNDSKLVDLSLRTPAVAPGRAAERAELSNKLAEINAKRKAQ